MHYIQSIWRLAVNACHLPTTRGRRKKCKNRIKRCAIPLHFGALLAVYLKFSNLYLAMRFKFSINLKRKQKTEKHEPKKRHFYSARELIEHRILSLELFSAWAYRRALYTSPAFGDYTTIKLFKRNEMTPSTILWWKFKTTKKKTVKLFSGELLDDYKLPFV